MLNRLAVTNPYSSRERAWMEHRCWIRVVCSEQVLVQTTLDVSAPAILCNISASGALLRCPLPVPLYARVIVRLPSQGRGVWRSGERVEAQIVRCSTGGFAVEWLEFSPEVVRNSSTVRMPRGERRCLRPGAGKVRVRALSDLLGRAQSELALGTTESGTRRNGVLGYKLTAIEPARTDRLHRGSIEIGRRSVGSQ
jgi:hypothetical protein